MSTTHPHVYAFNAQLQVTVMHSDTLNGPVTLIVVGVFFFAFPLYCAWDIFVPRPYMVTFIFSSRLGVSQRPCRLCWSPVSYPLFTASRRSLREVNGHDENARHLRDRCCLLPLARRVGRVLRRRGRLAEQSLATRSLQLRVFRHCNHGILNPRYCSLATGT